LTVDTAMSTNYRRIGFIGDIHAEDEMLERALDVLGSRGVELVAATGDIADGAGSVDRCCALLESRRVVTVRGNHDRWLVAGTVRDLPDATPIDRVTAESRRWLAELPEMVELDTVGGRALLCHGLGPNDMAKVGPHDFGYALDANDDLQDLLRGGVYRWILNGHSHQRMVRDIGGVTLINAGTLARHQEPCFLELDFEAGSGLVFMFDSSGRVGTAPEAISLGTAERR
jgi:predicted phosphodiesterase